MRRFLFQTNDGQVIPVTIAENTLVSKVKDEVADMVKANPADLVFTFGNRTLQDDLPISKAGIPKNGFIQLSFRSNETKSLTVAGPDGKIAKTRFKANATVAKAKATLAKLFNLGEDANLVFQAQVLPPDALLSSLNLPDDAVVKIEEPPTKLQIYSESGQVAVSRFKPNVTVDKVRSVMAARFGIDPDLAVAKYNGRVLADSESLESLQLTNDGRFEIVTGRVAQEITVKIGGKVAKSRFTETATVGKMKEVLAEALHTEPENVSLNLGDPSIDDHSFVKDLGVDTIEASIIPESPSRNSRITFDLSNDPEAPQPKPKSARAIQFRFSNGKAAKARFKSTATVGKAKEKLASAMGLSPEAMEFDGVDNDETLLSDVPMQQPGVIRVRIISPPAHSEEDISLGNVSPIRTITIRVSDGKIAKARFKETATIGKVKEVMAKALYTSPENVSIPNIEEDDKSLIKDVNIPEEGLYIERTSPKIKVVKPLVIKFEDGTIVQSRFRLAATVGKVKQALASIAKKPASKIDLTFENQTLDDGMLISELDIPDDGFLFVHTRD